MQTGDKVQVNTSVVVFNHPEHRGEAFDMQGQNGENRDRAERLERPHD
jgi:hypothetical protein